MEVKEVVEEAQAHGDMEKYPFLKGVDVKSINEDTNAFVLFFKIKWLMKVWISKKKNVRDIMRELHPNYTENQALWTSWSNESTFVFSCI